MAKKKYTVKNTNLLHNGKTYKIGEVIELEEDKTFKGLGASFPSCPPLFLLKRFFHFCNSCCNRASKSIEPFVSFLGG